MEYDKEKYKALKLPHPLLLHWILNPGLAFNELILGQRIPKITLIDKTSSAPFMERQYIPCPDCGAMNDGRLWSKSNAMGHWFGYVCPECGGRIPCLWNITSITLLAVTFPIWIWIKIFAEKRWIEKEKNRFADIRLSELPKAKTTSWVKMGAIYGGLMFCFMSFPKILKNQMLLYDIVIQLAVWAGAGLVFGMVMKFCLGRRNKNIRGRGKTVA
jgi:hypothetical protein